MRGLVVAGTGSGIGKTTVTAALLAGLAARGLTVQAFKSGPDYIDPAHHARLTGHPSYNLDTWMLTPEANRAIFAHACRKAQIALVEGAMGLFDGVSGASDAGSTAEIAKLLGLPVLLVVDVSNVARSVAAVIKGFQVFDPELRILGVILNRAAGPGHVELLKESILSTGVPVIGWLPEMPEVRLRERHLGLVTAAETSWTSEQIRRMAAAAEENISLDLLLSSTQQEIPLAWNEGPASLFHCPTDCNCLERVRIGVARDEAFSFYYESSLEVLRAQGAELVEFSPLSDLSFPAQLDGLYIGGGYPEVYAEQLSQNEALLFSIRDFARQGHPIYGECGGLMYLAEDLSTGDGRTHPMASLLPLSIAMCDRLQAFGYTEIEVAQDCLLAPRGTSLRGHSFHHSQVVRSGPVQLHYRTNRLRPGTESQEGYGIGTVFGSYIHLNFAARPEIATRFLWAARQSRKRGERG